MKALSDLLVDHYPVGNPPICRTVNRDKYDSITIAVAVKKAGLFLLQEVKDENESQDHNQAQFGPIGEERLPFKVPG